MRRLICVMLALGALPCLRAADPSDARLTEALAVARTNLSGGIALCDKAITEFPTNAQPLSVRAKFFDRAHRYDDAIRDLSAALKLDEKNGSLWQARGEMN